jgi:hypothetical protein
MHGASGWHMADKGPAETGQYHKALQSVGLIMSIGHNFDCEERL